LSPGAFYFVFTKTKITMTLIEYFKNQFVEEAATTRKMLSRIPEGKWDYKPHEKSMNLKSLAGHLADLPGWIHMTLTTDELDFAQSYEEPQFNSTTDLMTFFEKRYADGLSTLVPENEAVLNKPWTLRNGDTVYMTEPKVEVLRMSFSQQIHHRAQLGVYLRLLNVPIPGSYGPSADEAAFA
jgi:uncharacterized damage-inducible protein DinB